MPIMGPSDRGSFNLIVGEMSGEALLDRLWNSVRKSSGVGLGRTGHTKENRSMVGGIIVE